jgi:hypothetical protein
MGDVPRETFGEVPMVLFDGGDEILTGADVDFVFVLFLSPILTGA